MISTCPDNMIDGLDVIWAINWHTKRITRIQSTLICGDTHEMIEYSDEVNGLTRDGNFYATATVFEAGAMEEVVLALLASSSASLFFSSSNNRLASIKRFGMIRLLSVVIL